MLSHELTRRNIVPSQDGRSLLDAAGVVVAKVGDYEIVTNPRAQAPHKVGDTVVVCASFDGRQWVASHKNGQWS